MPHHTFADKLCSRLLAYDRRGLLGDRTWVFVAVGYTVSRAAGLISKQNVSGLPRQTRIYFSCVFLQLDGMLTPPVVGAGHGVPPPTLRPYQTAKCTQPKRNSTNDVSRSAFGFPAQFFLVPERLWFLKTTTCPTDGGLCSGKRQPHSLNRCLAFSSKNPSRNESRHSSFACM